MKKILLATAMMVASFSAQAENLVDVNSDAFGEAVRAYLMEHPEVIIEAVDKYNANEQAKLDEAAQGELAALKPALLDEKTGFILGKADAKLAIVEFVDYNCGYCRKAHEAIDAILASDPDVKIIVRQLPILSEGSLEIAQVILAINTNFGSEKAAAFHEAAYKHEGQLDKAAAMEIAKGLGLDVAKIEASYADPANLNEINAMHEAAKKLKIEGTPGFIIGDQIIRGYIPEDQLKTMIAEERG